MEAGASFGVGTGTATFTRRADAGGGADTATTMLGGASDGGASTSPSGGGGGGVDGGTCASTTGGVGGCGGGSGKSSSASGKKGGKSSSSVQKSSVGVIQLACITFFTVAGGPYGFEDTVGAAGGVWTLVGLAVVPFLWSIPLALLTAELSSMIPEAGGHIIWVDKAFGQFVSFQNGIWSFYTSALDNALYPVMFCDYLEEAIYPGDSQFPWVYSTAIKLTLVVVITYLNILGVDVVGNAAVMFSVAVMAPFVVMCFIGIPKVETRLRGALATPREEPYDWGRFFAVMLWNTSGFDCAGTCADEVADPGKTYPQALMLAVAMVVSTYAAPTLVGLVALPETQEWEDGAFVAIAELTGGKWLGNWMGLAGAVSATGLLCTLLCTSSRQLAGMASTGAVNKIFTAKHPKYGTPYVSIILVGVLAFAFTGLDFSMLAEADMFFYTASTILKFGALVKLRVKMKDAHRPFSIPGGVFGVVAMSFAPVCLCLTTILTCSGLCFKMGGAGFFVASLWYYYAGGAKIDGGDGGFGSDDVDDDDDDERDAHDPIELAPLRTHTNTAMD